MTLRTYSQRSNESMRSAAIGQVWGVLLLLGGLAIGMGHLAGRAVGQAAAVAAVAVPRDPHLIDGIRFQVALMRDRGMIADIYDGRPGGRPTVVVVTDRYLGVGNLEAELHLYGGHYVGFADDYAWLINGHHDVRLVRVDGTEIGRRKGDVTDAQVQEIYRQNRRRLEREEPP